MRIPVDARRPRIKGMLPSSRNALRTAAALAATVLVSALVSAPAQAAADTKPALPSAPSAVAVKGVHNLKPKVAQHTSDTDRTFKPRATAWPKAAKGSARLAEPTAKADGTKQTAANTPVWVQATKSGNGAYKGPSDVGVTVLDHQKSAALGISGVVFTVDPSATATGEGKVRVGVDYSAFAEA